MTKACEDIDVRKINCENDRIIMKTFGLDWEILSSRASVREIIQALSDFYIIKCSQQTHLAHEIL